MKRNFRILPRSPMPFLALGLALILIGAGDARAAKITTGPISNVDLQVLVDLADPGDKILLEGGVYDFFTTNAPVRITKKLKIQAADPSDPPIIEGDGTIGTPFDTGNNGFIVFEQATDIVGLTIEGITFRDLDRSVAFGPAHPAALGPCEIVAPGRLRHATVRNCRFEDSRRGTQSYGGQVENLSIVDNVFDGVSQPIVLLGGVGGCSDAPGFFDIGRSRLTTVARNHVSGAGTFGIHAVGVVKAAIDHNIVEGGGFGIVVGDDTALSLPDDGPIEVGQVIGNELSDQILCAIYGIGPTTLKKTLIANNVIRDTLFTGICLDTGANNMQVSNNDISGVVLRDDYGDINLGDATVPPWGFPPTTYDNVVIITDDDTIVIDGGIDNRILGKP